MTIHALLFLLFVVGNYAQVLNQWRKVCSNGDSTCNGNTNPAARKGQGVSSDSNIVFLFGGATGQSGPYLNDLWYMNLLSGTSSRWQSLCSSATLCKSQLAPDGRMYMGLSAAGSRILMFGGVNGIRTYNDLWSFSLLTQKWVPLCSHADVSSPTCNGISSQPMPNPTSNMGTATVLNFVTSQYETFFFGGRSPAGFGFAVASLWSYTTSTSSSTSAGVWSQVCGDTSTCNGVTAPIPRQDMAFTAVGTTLWMFGGKNTAGNYFNDLWSMQTSSSIRGWQCHSGTFGCNGIIGTLPSQRAFTSFAALSFDLYLLGGQLNGFSVPTNDLTKFTTSSTGTNTQITTLCSDSAASVPICNGAEMPSQRFDHSLVSFNFGNALALFGGTDNSGFRNDLWLYSTAASGLSCDWDNSQEYCGDTATCVVNNGCATCGSIPKGNDESTHVCRVLNGPTCNSNNGGEYCSVDNTCKPANDCSGCNGKPHSLSNFNECVACSADNLIFCSSENKCVSSCLDCDDQPVDDNENKICIGCSDNGWLCSTTNQCVENSDCSTCTGLPVTDAPNKQCLGCADGQILCKADNSCKNSGVGCSTCSGYPNEGSTECTACSIGRALCIESNACQSNIGDCSQCLGHGAYNSFTNVCTESNRASCQNDGGRHYCADDDSCQPAGDCSACKFAPIVDAFNQICIPGSESLCNVQNSKEFCDVNFMCLPDNDCSGCPGSLTVDTITHRCRLTGDSISLIWTYPGQFQGNIDDQSVTVSWTFSENIVKGAGFIFWTDGRFTREVAITDQSISIDNNKLVWSNVDFPDDAEIEVKFSQNNVVVSANSAAPTNLHQIKWTLVFSTSSSIEASNTAGMVLDQVIDDFKEASFQEAIALSIPLGFRPHPYSMVNVLSAFSDSTGVTMNIINIASGNSNDIFDELSTALSNGVVNTNLLAKGLGAIITGTAVSTTAQSSVFGDTIISNAPDKCGKATEVSIELTMAGSTPSNIGVLRNGILAVSFPDEWVIEDAMSDITVELQAPQQGATRTYTATQLSTTGNTLFINMVTSPFVRNIQNSEQLTVHISTGITMPPTCRNMNTWIWVVRSTSGTGDIIYGWKVLNPSDDSCKGATTFLFGDPHFISFSGGQYDITGSAGHFYNIISDKYFNWNSKFVNRHNHGEEMTYLGITGFIVNGTHIVCDPDTRTLAIENKVIEGNGERVYLSNDSRYYVKVSDGLMFLHVPGYRLVLKPIYKAHGYPLPHFDHLIDVVEEPNREGRVNPHGLLGQTANFKAPVRPKNKNGLGVIEGTVKDYEVRSLFGMDFKFNRYGDACCKF